MRAEKPQYIPNFQCGGLLPPPRLTDQDQFWHARIDPCPTLNCQLSCESVYAVAKRRGVKTQILRICNFLVLRWLHPELYLNEVELR